METTRLSARRSDSLSDRLRDHRNSLNFVRLVLATFVVITHGWMIVQVTPPFSFIEDLSRWGVRGFFTISGFLILASGLRTSTGAFMWRRVLRIYPGYFVCLLVTAFLIAPLLSLFTGAGSYSLGSALYSFKLSPFLRPELNFGGIIDASPFPFWNSPLWTLIYEFAAYMAVAALCLFAFFRVNYRLLCPLLFGLFATAGLAVEKTLHVPDGITNAFTLGTFFLGGMVVYSVREKIPASLPAALIVSAVFYLSDHFTSGQFQAMLTAIPLALTCLLWGAVLKVKLFQKTDISYGTYIYGFPLAQVLVIAAGATAWSVPVFVLATLAITYPVAYLSWTLIESRAQKAKSLVKSTGWPEMQKA
ncbi:acyltransferase [Dermabacteraceae bacterium TAE3-ERU27]|nr:acyltransferase [Dermabacteraceae bacterium TAE3-ERU27]